MIEMKQNEDFAASLSRLYGYGTDDIKNITFQVTDRCSLKCSYCYQINKSTRRMKFETAKKFIDLIFSGEKGFREYLGKPKAIICDFIGGEPTLEPELMDQIVDYLYGNILAHPEYGIEHFRISISSNGMHYFEPKVQKFLQKHKNHLSFNISIDGNKELHDMCRRTPDGKPSYDIAMAGVNDWRAKGNYMGSKITLAPANIRYCYEASKHMVENGYQDININCVFEEGWTKEDAKIEYQQLKQFADYLLELDRPQDIYYALFRHEAYGPVDKNNDDNFCGGDGKMIALDPDGRIFPCIRYMESALGTEVEPLCIGDVDNGIGKCAKCQKCLSMLKGITRSSQSTEECMNCPVGSSCAWCSGYNYQRFGTLNHRATFICWMHKAESLACAYYRNKLNRKFNDKDRIKIYLPKEDALEIISEDEYNMLVELSKEE